MINNPPKRHFYNGKEYNLDFEQKKLVLNPEFHKLLLDKKLWGKFGFKKIGGSSVGDVLETDKFKSTFSAFCRIAWCGLPTLDRKYVDAGIIIEPMVVKVIEDRIKTTVTTYPPEKYDFDYFKESDDVIGGIPDGYIERDNIIIEIKTTGAKNFENWNQFGIPDAYKKQAQLYAHLIGAEKFWIVAAFLNDEDYVDPKSFPIKNRKLKSYTFLVNKEQVEDDINKMKSWYKQVTESGISPTWDDTRDKDLIEYLECKNYDEYISLLEKWKVEGKFIDK